MDMILENSIKISNYKCFDDTPEGFERIFPINIIVGKNNSAKSSLLDIVRHLVDKSYPLPKNRNSNNTPSIHISDIINSEDIDQVFQKNTSRGGIPGTSHNEYGQNFIGHKVYYDYTVESDKTNLKWDNYDWIVQPAIPYIKKLINNKKMPFNGKNYRGITAERDIVPESNLATLDLNYNGAGATYLVRQITTQTKYDSRIIQKELLNELNKILLPELNYASIFVQETEGIWEIFLEDSNDTTVALSKMGSGIKTILLVLLNLIAIPKLYNVEHHQYVYAFEELENNLHPSLLRRLFNYIKEYSAKNKSYFFITTHSNVVIDLFGRDINAQILHTQKTNNKTIVTTVSSALQTKNILRDLEIKASDLLQTNGIIWVEGPSDRIYLNRWIKLLNPDLQEGLHYSILFYGGRLLSNLTFDFEWLAKELIPLLKINHNAFVLIDKDGKSISSKLNDTKTRIQNEIGNKNCWITKGREIENYLTDSTLNLWLKNVHGELRNIKNTTHEKLENTIGDNGIKLKYDANKKLHSQEIIQYINESDLDILDLKVWLTELVTEIQSWNS